MKVFAYAVIYHVICIILFTGLYFYLRHHFYSTTSKDLNGLDMLMLSTTIQSGVGISDIYPNSTTTKIFLVLQQFLMMTGHLFMIYTFNL